MLLTTLICSALNIFMFNFDMPNDLINGATSDATLHADVAGHADWLRQVTIFTFALVGLAVARGACAGWPSPVGWLGAISVSMVAWDCLSYAWSDSPDIVGRRIVAMLLSAVGAFGISRLKHGQIRLLLTALALQNLLIGLANEIFLGTLRPFSAGYRFAGTFHPNFQGWNDALLVLLSLSYISERKAPAAVKWPIFCLGVTSLLLTNSRTALICLIFTATFRYGVRSTTSRSSSSLPILIGVGFLASVALLLHGAGLIVVGDVARLVLGAERDEGDIESMTGRVDVWESCLRFAAGHWASGFGFSGFWTPERILEISQERQWVVNQAHSTYIDQILSTGVVGLSLYIAALLLGVASAIQSYRQSRSEATLLEETILVFAIVHGLTESIAISPVMCAGTMLMILVAKFAFGPQERD